jgi:hypothetical protein
MEISKSIETPQGTVQFKGELSQEEADFVIKVGLSVLLQNGMLPVKFDQDNIQDVELDIKDAYDD